MAYNKSGLLLIVTLSSILLGHAYRHPAGKSIWFTDPAPTPAPSPVPSNPVTDVLGGFDINNINLNNVKSAVEEAKSKVQVDDFCTGTEHPELCAQTIAPLFVEGVFDPLKALEAELGATLNETLKVVGKIAELVEEPDTSVDAMDALDVCRETYDYAVDAIKESIELLKQMNIVDAYHKVSSINSNTATCDDTFAETEATNPLPRDVIDTIFKLTGNCLAILDGWVNNQNKMFV
ncbi:hypothetical protein PIB30_012831 [Stylosanthes scabra]|uniref:Pectinesterase inhibitor domain-containing protein n=1 Tax=Stylosanthes scabra TaxID=79078 RepID=A0ABU6V5A0_9FABA|nr:hypothetical protein [Stylosanthes scabra]